MGALETKAGAEGVMVTGAKTKGGTPFDPVVTVADAVGAGAETAMAAMVVAATAGAAVAMAGTVAGLGAATVSFAAWGLGAALVAEAFSFAAFFFLGAAFWSDLDACWVDFAPLVDSAAKTGCIRSRLRQGAMASHIVLD